MKRKKFDFLTQPFCSNQHCYCTKLNLSLDLNSLVNNNNGCYSYTGFVEKLNTEHFIMLSGVEQETGVYCQKQNY